MNSVAASLKVEGLVQGVGYRYFCHRKAKTLGLSGWVRNEPDRSVSVFVEGDRSLIESLIEDLKVGPHSSQVTNINIKWKVFTGAHLDFQIQMTHR